MKIKKFNENAKSEYISYIADVTIETLFSVCLNGMEYGIGQRKVIGDNNGIFDEDYVKSIVENTMDDHDIFQDIGDAGFDEVFDDIKGLCEEYLELADESLKYNGEVRFIKDEYEEVYNNIINSLKNIVK